MMRIVGSLCLLVLLYGTALADDARRLRIEAGVLIQKAEVADNALQRRTLLETAHGKLLEVQQRFPDRYASLTLYLAGNRVSLSPSDVAAMVETATLADFDVGNLRDVLGRYLSSTAVDENGWTDLHWAAALNQPELARALIDLGADVEAALHDDGEPLSDRLSQSLKEVGFDLQFSRRGYHPSHISAFADATDALTALFTAGAEINAKATNNGWTPLHAAAWANAGEVAAVLIERGTDIDAKDITGNTPLHLAAWTNAGEIAAILIERDADVSGKNSRGSTPLHAAASGNAKGVAMTLIERGADIDAKNGGSETPLHFAAYTDAGETAAVLINHGADIYAKNNDGQAPLDVATANDAHAVVEILRKQLEDL